MGNSNKYRVTQLDKSNVRRIISMNELELQKFRARRLQKIRKEELHLSQKLLAEVVGVELSSIRDWETGHSPMPKTVEILLNLMKEMPSVKEKLLSATK